MPNRLSDLEIDEVSLVDRPANPLSKVLLFKRDTSGEEDEILGTDNGADYSSMTKEETMPEDTGTVELTPEYVESLEEMVLQLQDELAAVKKSADDGKEDVLKNLDPKVADEVLTRIAKAEARAAESEAIAKAERDTRITREYLTKAETKMEHLPGTASEKASILKGLNDIDTDLANKVEQMLISANEQAALGAIDDELGRDVLGDSTAMGEIEKLAKSLQASNSDLTYEQAVDKALSENPALYTKYLEG